MRSAIAAAALLLAGPAAAQEQPSAWTDFPSHATGDAAPMIRHGQEVFQARCDLCHGAVGPGIGGWMAGTQALQAKYGGKKPAMLEARTDLTPELVRYYVRHGSGIMPFFRKTEVSDADLDALAAYLARKRR